MTTIPRNATCVKPVPVAGFPGLLSCESLAAGERLAESSRAPDRLRRLAVEKALAAELECSRQRQRVAGCRLRDLTGQVPSSFPAADGNLQLREAGAEYVDALAAYQTALARFTEFVTRGIVPEDLLKARY